MVSLPLFFFPWPSFDQIVGWIVEVHSGCKQLAKTPRETSVCSQRTRKRYSPFFIFLSQVCFMTLSICKVTFPWWCKLLELWGKTISLAREIGKEVPGSWDMLRQISERRVLMWGWFSSCEYEVQRYHFTHELHTHGQTQRNIKRLRELICDINHCSNLSLVSEWWVQIINPNNIVEPLKLNTLEVPHAGGNTKLVI